MQGDWLSKDAYTAFTWVIRRRIWFANDAFNESPLGGILPSDESPERGINDPNEAQSFCDFYESKGWVVGKSGTVLKTVDGDESGLDADKLDGVELAEIQSEIDDDISNHTANASAHHSRYSNAEAVAAMGTKANTNSLNHDRHTPVTILADLKTVDGKDSGLDADKLDGAELSDIQAEIDSDIDIHSTNASAHHSRYTNSEAVAAVEAGKVAFRARIPSGQALPSSGTQRVEWDTTDFNEGGGYSTTTFLFTAPSDGYYFFHAQLYLFGLDLQVGTRISLKLSHNSGSIAYDYREITHKDGQLGLPCLQVTAVENANAGDLFSLRVSHDNSGKTVYIVQDTEFSFFCGHRI